MRTMYNVEGYLGQEEKVFKDRGNCSKEKHWRQIFPEPVQALVSSFYIPLSLSGTETLDLVEPRAQQTPSGQTAISNLSEQGHSSRLLAEPHWPALAWEPFGKMFRQYRTKRSKIMCSFSTSPKTEGSLKQGSISRNCLQSKAVNFLSNKVTKAKIQNKRKQKLKR